jgi:uncharacterized protein (TIGR00369 family)
MHISERSRTVTWDDPRPGARAARTMSGLEYLQAMQRGDLPDPPIMRLLAIEFVEAEAGRVVFAVTPAEFHYNPIGSVHGGLAATLCDSAMGCAVHSALPAGDGYTTLELKVNLVRPLTVETGQVTCEGRVLHLGARVATAEARVTDAAGRLYAHATTTCLLLRGAGGGQR